MKRNSKEILWNWTTNSMFFVKKMIPKERTEEEIAAEIKKVMDLVKPEEIEEAMSKKVIWGMGIRKVKGKIDKIAEQYTIAEDSPVGLEEKEVMAAYSEKLGSLLENLEKIEKNLEAEEEELLKKKVEFEMEKKRILEEEMKEMENNFVVLNDKLKVEFALEDEV